MVPFDNYHVLVHDLTAFFGYRYDDTAPDWIHPFIYLILVLVPAMLIAVVAYFGMRGAIKFWTREGSTDLYRQPLRGLEASLFKTVMRYSKKQQVLMIFLSLLAMPILYLTLELPKQRPQEFQRLFLCEGLFSIRRGFGSFGAKFAV
jgi:hypothetical protein